MYRDLHCGLWSLTYLLWPTGVDLARHGKQSVFGLDSRDEKAIGALKAAVFIDTVCLVLAGKQH